jgi:hypothetical protein
MGGVESEGGDVSEEALLLELDDGLNLLVVLVGGELGLGDDFAEELGEVREVVAEELGFDDEAFAGVVGGQLAAEDLSLAGDSEG